VVDQSAPTRLSVRALGAAETLANWRSVPRLKSAIRLRLADRKQLTEHMSARMRPRDVQELSVSSKSAILFRTRDRRGSRLAERARRQALFRQRCGVGHGRGTGLVGATDLDGDDRLPLSRPWRKGLKRTDGRPKPFADRSRRQSPVIVKQCSSNVAWPGSGPCVFQLATT